MKDVELIDHTLGRIAQAGDMEIEIEARDLERICKLALEQVKNCSIPDVVGQSEQLVCDCGKEYHERDLEHGMCHKCWQPTKEAMIADLPNKNKPKHKYKSNY